MSFDNLIGYILSISICMQNFITTFFIVQEIGPFSRFQNLELGKASTDKKCHFAISWARFCQYQCLRKSFSKYSTQFKRLGHFHFFRIWHSTKPRPMINVILWFLGQIFSTSNCLQNFIKIFQTVQEINSTFFRTWTSAKPRSNPNIIWQSHGLHLVNTSVYAKFNHNIPFNSRDRAIFTFSEFGARQSLDRW